MYHLNFNITFSNEIEKDNSINENIDVCCDNVDIREFEIMKIL